MEADENMEYVEEDFGPHSMDEDDGDDESVTSNEESKEPKKVYLPGQKLKNDEELVCDDSAYVMLHQAQSGAPCLSFDVIESTDFKEEFPLTSYIVAGTQATRTHVNNIIVMKMYNLHKTTKEKTKAKAGDGDGDDDSEDDDDEDDDENSGDEEEKKPKMNCALIKHQGCVNRIRSTQINNYYYAAAWSELGTVSIWNLNSQLQAVEDSTLLHEYENNDIANTVKPVYTFSGHQLEGFAIDWCSIVPGVLATGDCRRDIHIWKPLEDGTWNIDQRPLLGHTQSVEDIQWSPNEPSVLASCSVDKSIRIWDIRAAPQKACMLTCDDAHLSDINVISWNKNEPFIVSGGDDGCLHIWDLRNFQNKKPIATFNHHTSPVTTVEWYPKDPTVFASGGEDDQIAIWDLGLEEDSTTNTTINKDDELKNLPPQLLFIHQGQQEIKELHWHPQSPGVLLSTANSGFNIFKTISV